LKVGVAWREPWRAALFADQAAVDCIELTCEHVLDGTAEQLALIDLLARHWTVLPHGLDLSLGSVEGLDPRHVSRLAQVIARSRCPWWSEHLAYTRAGGRRLGHLAPLPPTRTAVAVVARHVAQVRREIAVPLLLENIACPVELTGEFDEPGFIRAVADASGCELLFDVSNAWLGCMNRGEDFRAYLDRFPLDRVRQLHVAGFRAAYGRLLDSHADDLDPRVIAAVAEVRQRCAPAALILERDDDLPPFAAIRQELEALRAAG
jgi:uncharacterized protein (UPF0276 family)